MWSSGFRPHQACPWTGESNLKVEGALWPSAEPWPTGAQRHTHCQQQQVPPDGGSAARAFATAGPLLAAPLPRWLLEPRRRDFRLHEAGPARAAQAARGSRALSRHRVPFRPAKLVWGGGELGPATALSSPLLSCLLIREVGTLAPDSRRGRKGRGGRAVPASPPPSLSDHGAGSLFSLFPFSPQRCAACLLLAPAFSLSSRLSLFILYLFIFPGNKESVVIESHLQKHKMKEGGGASRRGSQCGALVTRRGGLWDRGVWGGSRLWDPLAGGAAPALAGS